MTKGSLRLLLSSRDGLAGGKFRDFTHLVKPLAQVEQEAIESAMILCLGNVNKAAAALGISRSTLFRKLREYREQA